MSDLLSEGLSVTLKGIGIVVLVLALLLLLTAIIKKFFYKPEQQAHTEIIPEEQHKIFTIIEEREMVEEMEREELIAVLTAAVAASLNQSTYNLKVTSFRRINNNTPVWNAISRKEQIDTRL